MLGLAMACVGGVVLGQAKANPATALAPRFVDNPTTVTQVEVNGAAIAGLRACTDVTEIQFQACMEIVSSFIASSGGGRQARGACNTGKERAEDACFERNGFEIPPETFQRRNAVAQIFTETDACGNKAQRNALACLDRGESQDNCTKTAIAAIDKCGAEQAAKIKAVDIPGERDGGLRAKRRTK